MRRTHDFQTIRSEGGLLPPDLLRRVLDPKGKLDGTRPEDYGLPPGDRLNEIITQSWNRLRKYWADFRAAAANLSVANCQFEAQPQAIPGFVTIRRCAISSSSSFMSSLLLSDSWVRAASVP
jgi:hypothetical protein